MIACFGTLSCQFIQLPPIPLQCQCYMFTKTQISVLFPLVPERATHFTPSNLSVWSCRAGSSDNLMQTPSMMRSAAPNVSNVDSNVQEMVELYPQITKKNKKPEHQTAPVHHKGRLVGLMCSFSQTQLEKRGWCHFSVTAAAAIGERMVPHAVAASSSISALSRLITHSMASRPFPALAEMVLAITPSK